MVSKQVTVINKTGIHARPASAFVQTAGKFKSDITIEKGGTCVSAKSLIRILGLSISKDTEITIHASGEDENEALEALINLVKSGFGE